MKDLPLAMSLLDDPKVTALIGEPFTQNWCADVYVKRSVNCRSINCNIGRSFLLVSDEYVGCAGLRPYRAEQRVCELGMLRCLARTMLAGSNLMMNFQ
jgi:hypothetical protein